MDGGVHRGTIAGVQIAVPGPLEVRAASGPAGPAPARPSRSARLRAMLIQLAFEPAHTVTAARLIDAVRADEPPANAANARQALVLRLQGAGALGW